MNPTFFSPMIFLGHSSSHPPAIVKSSKTNLILCWLLILLMSFPVFFPCFNILSSFFLLSLAFSLPASILLSLPHPPLCLPPSFIFFSCRWKCNSYNIQIISLEYPWGPSKYNRCYFLLWASKLSTVEIENLFSQRSIEISWNKLQQYWKKINISWLH